MVLRGARGEQHESQRTGYRNCDHDLAHLRNVDRLAVGCTPRFFARLLIPAGKPQIGSGSPRMVVEPASAKIQS